MKALITEILKFRDERDWKQFHSPENLAKSIVIEAGELLENFQWNKHFDKKNVTDELADIFNYCILLADSLDVDLVDITKAKLIENEKKYPVNKSKGNSRKYNEL